MPCSSSVIDEAGNTFRIEGPYDLNCDESKSFGYIDTFTIWRGEKCCGPYPDWPSSHQLRNHSKEMKDSPRCFWCNNWCRVSVSCIPKEYVTLDRCFWEERTAVITIYKNDEPIEHYSVSLTVGPHLEAPYGFWRHTNNATGKESIFLNTATSNYLEGTNYNYSCTPLNDPGVCKQDYVMPEIRTANSMPNIPSCSTLVTLKTTDVIPVNCQTVKTIKNTESNSIGIKSISGSCDIKVKDKLEYQLYISIDEGSYRFFNDLQGISCNLIIVLHLKKYTFFTSSIVGMFPESIWSF
jgi:hypothetical protein